VVLSAYNALLTAINSGRPADFDAIPLGGTRGLTNPQSGLAFDLEGPDAHALVQPPAPAFASRQQAAEISENYWMALLRDVPFTQYAANPIANAAAADLTLYGADFPGPKTGGAVTTATLFRGLTPGDRVGPYLSQFFYQDCNFGANKLEQKITTTVPGVNYMTDFNTWLAVQRGIAQGPDAFDPVPRYIRSGRDIGQWVHIDVLFQAYFEAMLVLFNIGTPGDPNNPYTVSRNQIGFGTLGDPFIASVLCAVATRALKAVWFQKWFVHRRLRPENFAGRIHNHVNRIATYPIHHEILSSTVLDQLFRRNGTYLLPMAFPEGCPFHPSYGAGHATVAGACVTILKAFFDESFVISNPVEADSDGLRLHAYNGPALTVGGELDKLASNVAIGRNIAGVHWRSDATESLKLGEEIAIRFLQEEGGCLNENFDGFSLTRFDGRTVIV
jgi:membrane-associated phospholipid phosphatase